jgi:hypothetical protein
MIKAMLSELERIMRKEFLSIFFKGVPVLIYVAWR